MSLPMMTMWYSSSTLKELVLHLNVVVLGTDEEPAREDDDDMVAVEGVYYKAIRPRLLSLLGYFDDPKVICIVNG